MRQFIPCLHSGKNPCVQACGVLRDLLVCVLSVFAVSTHATATSADIYSIDLERQLLVSALIELAELAHFNWGVLKVEYVEGETVGPLKGYYTARQAVAELLKGTDIQYVWIDNKGLSITGKMAKKNLPQPGQEIFAGHRGAEQYPVLEEVKVTGTHIRGASSASPLLSFDRVDIERAGVSTTHEFILTLGQHFAGGVSEHNANYPTPGLGHNVGRGAGVNLRGLDSDSTLVLLNGRRFAPAGFGTFADISLIPLTAVERIEILTDGASAIYGTDAVGGVVNFHMRDEYKGAETRIRYGAVTEGSYNEVQVGHTWGTSWLSGHALISYEYFQHSALEAEDRSFTENVIGPYSLLPEQKRHSVVTSGTYELTDNSNVFGNAYFSKRDNADIQSLGLRTDRTKGETEQSGALLGIQLPLSDRWRLELAGMYSRNKTESFSSFIDTGEFSNSPVSNISFIESIDALMDGVLPYSKVGEIRIAAGVQYRHEGFQERYSLTRTGVEVDEDRDVTAIYGEVFVPIIGKVYSEFERLELSLAFRHEHYSDFGSTTDPKVGLLWSSRTGVSFRATYGTSFRAPLFNETIENNIRGFLIDSIPDTESNTPLTLFVFGNNASLQPETATTWTAGLDVSPFLFKGVSLSVTYFYIEYKDRVETPSARYDALTNPQYVPIVTTRSSPGFDPALIEFVASQPDFFNFTESGISADTEVIVDNRLRNMSQTMALGFDFMLDYGVVTDNGQTWEFIFSGTYMTEQQDQLFETVDPVNVDGTLFNIPNLRLRGDMFWSRDALAVSLFVNHTASYRDNRTEAIVKVNSWTTWDFNMSYDFGMGNVVSSNSVFSISIQNLLNREPPSVQSAFRGINFDPNNATAVGRLISLSFTKEW